MAVYFDNNATTPLSPAVLEAMMPFLTELYANPSSTHSIGRKARDAINIAREQVAELVHTHPSQVVFCSSGTEANNLAISGVVHGMDIGNVVVSPIEHPSVWQTVRGLADSCLVSQLKANSLGQVTLDSVEECIENKSASGKSSSITGVLTTVESG